jgi:recombinational DNA repair protein (RecF pathway)
MKLESDGILIALKPFNERDALGRIFTRDNGILVGMLRGAVVAKKIFH